MLNFQVNNLIDMKIRRYHKNPNCNNIKLYNSTML